MIVSLSLKLFHEALRFPFGSAVSRFAGRRSHSHYWLHREAGLLCWIDDLDRSSLDCSKRLNRPKTEAGKPILLLNDHPRDQWISQQRQQLRTTIIDA